MKQAIRVSEGQTLLDIAVQVLGDAERVFEIAQANGIDITDSLSVGQELAVTGDADVSKLYVVNALAANNPQPASDTDEAITQNTGIGFWKIGIDFKVS